jgi:hypothetical protein
MMRFFDIVLKNQQAQYGRKLNLSDCGLGDACVQVVSKILKKSQVFA